jgi:hypothetical protein
MPARNAAGVIIGQEVLKLSPQGKVLTTLGKPGVAGTGPDAFDRPTSAAVAPNGDIFVSDGHAPNKYGTGRVVKFSKDGHFVKSWGRKGSAPGEFDEPHDIFVGGSRGWVYVPTGETVGFRCSIRTGTSSSSGNNSTSLAQCL